MAYNQNTDYMAVMSAAEEKARNAKTDAERAAAQAEYSAAQASRNEKIAAMNAAGTNAGNYQQTNNSLYSPTPVSYIGSDGEKKTGYILDGKTYKDQTGTQRVDVGSVVPTGGGMYKMTENGGQKLSTAESYLYRDALENNELAGLRQQLQAVNDSLARAQSSNDAIYAAQLQQQQRKLQTQIDRLTRGYDDLNKQLYIDAMRQKRDLPQALAAMGYTGGLRESSLLDIDTRYANALHENELAKQQNIADLEAGMTDAETELAIARMQQEQEAQEKYDTRYLALLQQLAEEQAARAKAEKETTYVPTPTRQPGTAREQSFYEYAKSLMNKNGMAAAAAYLLQAESQGSLSKEESDNIAAALG